MFCQKCGAKLDDSARFCTTCGTEISAINDKPVHMSPVEGQIRQQMPYVSKGQVVQQQPKKKKHMMPFLIGGIVLVLVVALLSAVIGGGREIDYVRTVQEYTPFAVSQGLPYTLQEVMDEYFEDLVWEERTEDDDDEHCVEICGTLKTTEENIQLLVDVEEDPNDPDICYFSFRSLKYEGGRSSDEDEIVNFLAALFYGYDNGYDVEELMDETAIEEDTERENDSLTMADPKSYADMIPIMQTQSFYDEGFGNLEVTLNEVGFVDNYINDWGIQNYADDGYVFLWISYTVNNIGTTSGMMPFAWNTLIYDSTYEYRDCASVGDTSNIPPLSEPREGAFVYTLPVAVLEAGKSFVFHINDASGEPFMSCAFRLDGESADTSESETANITDPFLYTGKYEGYGGYEISFSSGTELEGDIVGSVEIYYNGELTAAQTAYECSDRGDWSDWDYDAFYVIHLGDQDAYLGFYERDGWKMLDYNGVTRNFDTLEMTEYYEAP